MDFLYGQLNNLIEAQKYEFSSSSNLLKILKNGNSINFNIDTTQLVTFRRIQKDTNLADDLIQYYGLFAFNENSGLFDIQLGDELRIDMRTIGSGDSGSSTLNKLYILTGQKQSVDTNGNPLYQPDGSPVLEPDFREVTTSTVTGQMIIDQIPVSALVDHYKILDSSGTVTKIQYIDSVIDGNAGGRVY